MAITFIVYDMYVRDFNGGDGMRNWTMIICLGCFALLLAAISETAGQPGYAYKQKYRGLTIKVEGIFLTTDPETGSLVANIPIHIENYSDNDFIFHSQKMKCNGQKVEGDIVDDYVEGEIKSGAHQEDVITIDIREAERESIDDLVFTYKVYDLKNDSSKSFSIKEEFSEG